mgnify:FL=1
MLPIDIEFLLNKQKVESNRIEFKKGWNPIAIYHSICAFANDIDNNGGGYILVGVEETNGIAVRPVKGVPLEQLDMIQKKIIGFNNLIDPYYRPRISVEDVDDAHVLVIWVPAGINRPYSVPRDVTAHLKQMAFYVRNGTSSEEAKGELLDQLRDLASRVPFDEKGNQTLELTDISSTLVRDYLVQVNSKLAADFKSENLEAILDNMNLFVGPVECRKLKNVAAMMFCEQLDRFFPKSQVDIVTFPEGRVQNPNKMVEAPSIKGTVPQMISKTLDYLRTNVIKEQIVKPKDNERSVKTFNYPYQALEEAVVNALYHRDYQEWQPVEITIEPDHISILSYSGPDRSISMDDIKMATALRSRRYRNVRLGDFLKELSLTEGRATGIPTIQDELRRNGSGRATLRTDESRTFFLIDIPCHPDFVSIEFRKSVEQLDIIRIREVLLVMLYRLVPSLYQVGNLAAYPNNQHVTDILDTFESNLDVVCTKSLEAWRDIQTLDVVAKAIRVMNNETSLKSLMDLGGSANRTRFKNIIINPLIALGLVEMTIPDKPNSRYQLYRLSATGRRVFGI